MVAHSPYKRFITFISPSYLSGILGFLSSLYLVLVSFWTQLGNTSIIRQSLGIFTERVAAVEAAKSTSVIFSDIFGNGYLNQAFYILAWAFIGVLAYFTCIIMIQGAQPIKDIINIHEQNDRYQKALLTETTTKLAFRILLTIILVVYLIVLVQLLIPVSVSLVRNSSPIVFPASIYYLLAACFILLAGFHLVSIILRLLTMKLRVFGDRDYLE